MARILIIEDDTDILRLYEEAMREAGHEVRAVETPPTSSDAWPADVVILDDRLGPIRGTDCIRRLRNFYPKARVIVATADADAAGRALTRGAHCARRKPFRMRDLLTDVRMMLEGSPGDAEPGGPRLEHIRALLESGKYAEAAWAGEKELERDDRRPEVWFLIGQAREASLSRGLAIQNYARAVQLAPQFMQARCNLVALLQEVGRVAEARDVCDAGLALDARNVILLVNRGALRLAGRDFRGAAEDFTAALEVRPELVPALVNRAAARAGEGNFALAVADLTEAIRIDPGNTTAWMQRGCARSFQGDDRGALADFDKAVRLDPASADALYNRGLAQEAAGSPLKACEDFRLAIRYASAEWPYRRDCESQIRRLAGYARRRHRRRRSK